MLQQIFQGRFHFFRRTFCLNKLMLCISILSLKQFHGLKLDRPFLWVRLNCDKGTQNSCDQSFMEYQVSPFESYHYSKMFMTQGDPDDHLLNLLVTDNTNLLTQNNPPWRGSSHLKTHIPSSTSPYLSLDPTNIILSHRSPRTHKYSAQNYHIYMIELGVLARLNIQSSN